jgi:hypothetical protein
MQITREGRIAVETAGVFLAFLLPAYLGGGMPSSLPPGISRIVLPTVLTSAGQIGLLIYLLAVQGEAARPEMGLRWPRPAEVAVAGLLAAGMAGILALAQLALTALAPEVQRLLARGARVRLAGWIELPAALVFTLAAAGREELLYRAYLVTRLRDLGVPAPLALVVSTALFAAAHAYQGYQAVALALVQGFILGGVFLSTRSLGVPTIAHALYNLTLLAATLAGPQP